MATDKNILYVRHKERMRERNREASAAGRDIGDIPEVENPEAKAKAKTSFRFFCEHYFPQLFSIPWSRDHLKVIAKIEKAITEGGLFSIAMPRGSGKALSIDTDLPSPDGWIKIRDVKVGDRLYDCQGYECKVTFATEIQYGRPCYELRFNDVPVIADENHLWLVCGNENSGFQILNTLQLIEKRNSVHIKPISKINGSFQKFKTDDLKNLLFKSGKVFSNSKTRWINFEENEIKFQSVEEYYDFRNLLNEIYKLPFDFKKTFLEGIQSSEKRVVPDHLPTLACLASSGIDYEYNFSSGNLSFSSLEPGTARNSPREMYSSRLAYENVLLRSQFPPNAQYHSLRNRVRVGGFIRLPQLYSCDWLRSRLRNDDVQLHKVRIFVQRTSVRRFSGSLFPNRSSRRNRQPVRRSARKRKTNFYKMEQRHRRSAHRRRIKGFRLRD